MRDTKVLVIDNHILRVERLSGLLDKAGYRVFQASQLSLSLEMLKEDKTNIILVGDSLEDTTMVELCRALKSNMATKDIATIACFSTIQRASASFPLLESFVDDYLIDSNLDWEILFMLAGIESSIEKGRQAQKQLFAQSKYYTSLFDKHPEAMYAFDLAGHFTYVNEAAINISGYSREELLNMSFPSLIAGNELAACLAYFEGVKRGETLFYTSRIVTKSGDYLEVTITLSPIIEAEKIIGLYGLSKDITSAVRLEQIALIEHQLRELALSGASLEENLLFLFKGFEGISRGMLCLLLCMDHERKTFTHPLASSLSQAYTSYLDGLSIEAVISPFGSVAESKQVLYLASLDIVRKWSDFRRRALCEGLQSLFCYPILSSAGEVMAVFALYYNKAQDAPAHDMELGSRAVKMIAILMERHQALKESHKKEQLLSQINSFIPGALYGFKIDKEGKISFPFYSAKMGELFNMDALEVENNIEGLFEKIHPEDRDAFWHSIQVSAQSMRPWLFDYRAIKGDSNEIMWLRGHSIPRSTDNGSILWYGLLVDITDIKKKEETLRMQGRAIEYAAQGIVITCPDLQDNPIIFANEQFLLDTGYAKEDVLGRNCRFLQGKDTDRQTVKEMREAIKAKKTFRGEILNYKKDGSSFWAYLVIAPVVDEKGKLTHYVGLMKDISDRKESERQLIAKNVELIKINSELDRFVYSVSHNLRAPLTSLLGLISISRLTEELAQRNDYLGHMEKSIHKLDATIQEINDYAKNARLELEIEKLKFHGLIGEVMEGLTYMEEAKGIHIGVDIDPAYDFYSDRGRLQVVLTNLLSNAIKYSDRSKEKPFIQISLHVSASLLRLSVKDNGMGIGEEHQEKIFSMFYRATTSSSGSGLGLYIVKENILKMKGTIKLLSEKKKGSEFIIHLPNLKP